MKTVLLTLACIALSTTVPSGAASAQRLDAEFEIASIKMNTTPRPPVNVVERTLMRATASAAGNGRYTVRAITLGALIEAAYSVRDAQVVAAPSWVNSERFDVDALAPGATTFEQMRPMLQALLADRFRLVLRRETTQLPVYELMPVRNGLKIAPMKAGSCVPVDKAKPFEPLNICGGLRRQIAGFAPERRDIIEAVGVPMAKLIEYLSEETGRVVIDKTGFTDVFNFRLEFASNVDAGVANVESPASALSIFSAVEEQLGMRLRSTTGPVDLLVIDRVERPSPN